HSTKLDTAELAWWRLHESIPVLASRRARACLVGLFAGLVAFSAIALGTWITGGRDPWFPGLKLGLGYCFATAFASYITSEGGAQRNRRTWNLAIIAGLGAGTLFGLATSVVELRKPWFLIAGFGMAYGLAAAVLYGTVGFAGLLTELP